jgi:hypothetical protein
MKPFKKMTRPRKAWLITWESLRQNSLARLKRSRIVCILDSRLPYRSIKQIVPALYCSEKRLVLSEKIVFGTCRDVQKRFMMKGFNDKRLTYGDNPCLYARKVDNLYVEARRFTQILRWTELPRDEVPRRARSFSQRYRWHVDF